MPTTRVDQLIGTPQYMSPEQIADPHHLDARSDIYSLGAVAYVLLTALPVFAGRSVVEVCSQHLYATPVPPSERTGPGISADLARVVLRCLEKDRAHRYPDVRALRDALEACRDAQRWTEQNAAEWWAAHGAALDTAPSAAPSDAPATIVADFAERAFAYDRTLASAS